MNQETNQTSMVYESAVSRQMTKYHDFGFREPLRYGVFYLADETGETPLWALHYDEKPTPQVHYEVTILDKEQLLLLYRPRTAVFVERELIRDLSGRDALVERLYTHKDGSHPINVSILSEDVNTDSGNHPNHGYFLVTQSAERRDAYFVTQVPEVSVREMLYHPSSILFLGAAPFVRQKFMSVK